MRFTKLEFLISDKMDEKYGDGDREYNWWGCSKSGSKTLQKREV